MIKRGLIITYKIWQDLLNYVIIDWLMYFPFHFVRQMFLRSRFNEIGSQTSFLMGLEFRNPKNISIGSNTVINKRVLLDGRGGKLIIGNNVDIAQETNIWTLEHDIHDDYHASSGGDVIIEDYVWVASRVTILPGVKIGKGSVIASNSVVTKSVPSMTIVGGVPARIIGKRESNLKYQLNYKPWFK